MAQQSFLKTERWLVMGPSMKREQAFFTEASALLRARRIADGSHQVVKVTRQVYQDGHWVNAPAT